MSASSGFNNSSQFSTNSESFISGRGGGGEGKLIKRSDNYNTSMGKLCANILISLKVQILIISSEFYIWTYIVSPWMNIKSPMFENTGFNMEFGKPRQKNFNCHICQTFKEIGFKGGPFFLFLFFCWNRLFSTPIQDDGFTMLRTYVFIRSWKQTIVTTK
jgi:hypothetical protein